MSEQHKLRQALQIRHVLNQIPFTIVMIMLAGAAVLIEMDRWRRGGLVLGIALTAAAFFRAALPTNRVGLLAVRSRLFDIVTLLLLGGIILWVAWTINPLGTRAG